MLSYKSAFNILNGGKMLTASSVKFGGLSSLLNRRERAWTSKDYRRTTGWKNASIGGKANFLKEFFNLIFKQSDNESGTFANVGRMPVASVAILCNARCSNISGGSISGAARERHTRRDCSRKSNSRTLWMLNCLLGMFVTVLSDGYILKLASITNMFDINLNFIL